MSPTAAVGSLAPRLKADGVDLTAKWLEALVHCSVDRGFGLIGRATLRFVDAGFALSSTATFQIGTDVEVKGPGQDGTLIRGVVTAVELQQTGASSAPEVLVTVDDRAARLAATTQSRTFLNQRASDVLAAICTGAGLTSQISGGSVAHPYLLQTGTDLAFLDQLVRRSGLVWWVEPSGRVRIEANGASTSEVKAELGVDVLSFSVRASSAPPDKVQVTGWDQAQQAGVSATAAAVDHRSRTQSPEFVQGATGRSGSGQTRGWASSALVATPTPLHTREAAGLAGALAAEAAAAAVTMTATCLVDPRLAPGVKFRVAGAGPAAGEYLLSRVEHVYNRTGFRTRVTSGPAWGTGIVDLGGARTTDSGQSLTALIPAIVTNVDSSGEHVGQVKVRYPSISGEVESAWARVLSLGAGSKRGVVFQPEVGDEVLVAFERGDTRRAVVLGGLYSERAQPPGVDTIKQSKVQYRRITSRKGHVLEFKDGDTDPDQHVLLAAKDGKHLVRVGNDRLEIKVGRVPLSISNEAGASIEFSDSGEVVIKGTKVTVKSTGGDTLVTSTAALTLKGTTELKAEGAITEIKGSGVLKVEAGGPLTVKGATVAIN